MPGPASRSARSCASCAARLGECTPARPQSIAGGRGLLPGPRVARSGRGRRERAGTGRQARQDAFSGRRERHVRQRAGKGSSWRAPSHVSGAFLVFGLGLWYKPLLAIRGWSRVRPLRAHLLHVAQRLPQVGGPGVLVLADQPHAPRERVAAAAGHPGVHQRVEDAPLRLAEPGHHRDGKCGEHHLVGVTDNAPGHLAAERMLRLPGDLYPGVTGLLTEPAAAADGGRLRLGPGPLPRPLRGGGPLLLRGAAAPSRRRCPPAGQVPDDRDLLPVDQDLGRSLEPVVRQPPGQPAPYLFRRAGRPALLPGNHVIMITPPWAAPNDFSLTP